MARAAIHCGGVSYVMPLGSIAGAVTSLVRNGHAGPDAASFEQPPVPTGPPTHEIGKRV